MPISSHLGLLLCGQIDQVGSDKCEVRDVLTYLNSAIASHVDDIPWVMKQSRARISRLAPFTAQTLLELGVTALICRLDPTRLLFVKRVQEMPAYAPDRVWKTAIRWQGDVVADKVNQLWHEGASPKEMTRALVGDYFSSLYWRPALQVFADVSVVGHGAWLAAIQGLTADAFIASRRSTLSSAFSESSKAIHHEYVVPVTSIYDKETSRQLIARVLQVLAEFGFLINCLAHIPYRAEAAATLLAVREIESYEV